MKTEQALILKAKLPVLCHRKKKYESKEILVTVDHIKVQSGSSISLWDITGIDDQVQDGQHLVVISSNGSSITVRPTNELDYKIFFSILKVATDPQFKRFMSAGMPTAVLACFGDIIFNGTACLEHLISLFADTLTTSPLSASGSVHSPRSPKLVSPPVSPRRQLLSGSVILDSAPKQYANLFTCLSDLGTYGMASIHIVCTFDRLDLLKILFSVGLSVSIQSSQERGRQTPLHYCLHDEKGSIQCFTYLVKELNASTHIENAYGLTVLNIIDAQWPGTYYHSLLDQKNDVMSNRGSARGSVCSVDD